MDDFDKAEKLREKADITYEEAQEALQACDGNLLDAMIYLEKKGKADAPKDNGSYSTSYDSQQVYTPVAEKVEEQQRSTESSRSAATFFRKVWHVIRTSTLAITHKESQLASMPLWLALLFILIFTKILIPAVIISLFFGVRYSLSGSTDLTAANRFCEKASDAAERITEAFTEKKS